jgi:biopolymer transport protein ExbB/TolQ
MQPVEISPVELFLQAGPVVKAVIILLIAASVWCWVIILESLWKLRQLKNAVASRGRSGGRIGKAAAGILAAGSVGALPVSNDALGAMKRRSQELVEYCHGGLSNLAVIASVAPFVGLFGTVWGIMSSFAGIAAAKDTSLAVVAPGIAEALAATAIGLAAAIPASFAYNRLAAAFTKAGRALNRLVEDEASGSTHLLSVLK